MLAPHQEEGSKMATALMTLEYCGEDRSRFYGELEKRGWIGVRANTTWLYHDHDIDSRDFTHFAEHTVNTVSDACALTHGSVPRATLAAFGRRHRFSHFATADGAVATRAGARR